MARPNQEEIGTFMSITGVSEATAVQKLEEHGGNLNEAINAHFAEEDTNRTHQSAGDVVDMMDIDDTYIPETHMPTFSPLQSSSIMNRFSLFDSNFTRSMLDLGAEFSRRDPFVSHPREVREIPIEVKDETGPSTRPGRTPIIEDVTDSVQAHVPEIHGTVTIDDDDDDDSVSNAQIMHDLTPSAPDINDLPNYNHDIEEEMIRAAIEASKKEANLSNKGDLELAHAVSLSLKEVKQEAEGEEVLRNGRQRRVEIGSSSIQDEVEETPLVRQRTRRRSVRTSGTHIDNEDIPVSPRTNGLDEWGGISSAEHDEAVMLETAIFGGHNFPSGTHQFMNNGVDRTVEPYFQRIPRTPSPSLTAQRELREQQDDEYLASLEADKEKELKAKEDAEALILQERRKEEIEKELKAKEASLPEEPGVDDENAITLVVKMPDGSRRGRRFLKSDKLQHLFDFIEIGRVIKAGTYRLVRAFPRRAFSEEESGLSFKELGISSKQEALFLELI